jgi:hypothetical protein
MASTLMTWKRKSLRKIYRPKCEQRVLRTSPDIVTEIKIRRLEWLGHIIIENYT